MRSLEADPLGERPSGLGVGGVPHHHALGPAGRPRGVDDGSHLERLCGEGRLVRLDRPRIQCIDLVVEQRDGWLKIIPHVIDFGVGQLGVDGRGNPAGPNRAEPGVHQGPRVRCRQQYAIAGSETAAAQRLCRGTSGPRQLAE